MFSDAIVYIVDDDLAARESVAALVGEMGVTAQPTAGTGPVAWSPTCGCWV